MECADGTKTSYLSTISAILIFCPVQCISVNEGDVVYTSSKEHFPLTNELERTLLDAFRISKGMGISELEEGERKNVVSILRKALLYKHQCWSYEEEVRVVKILNSMYFESQEWQSDPNRSYTTISKMVAPRCGVPVVSGLYIFNKKIPIKEVYLGKRNPLRLEKKGDSAKDDGLVKLANKLSWTVRLVNISTGTWGLDSEESEPEVLKIPGKKEGLST